MLAQEIVVADWTAAEIRALRQARRMSVRGFAAHLGVSDRTVSKWEDTDNAVHLRCVSQALLDTSLYRAEPVVRRRFVGYLAELPPCSTERRPDMNNHEHTEPDAQNDDHDFNQSEIQRQVVAVAIKIAESAIAAHERDYGRQPDPELRVRAIAHVAVHALNAYATEYHLDWTRHDWYQHQATTAIAAMTANDHRLVHELIVEAIDGHSIGD